MEMVIVFNSLGPTELLIILAIVILLFGASRIGRLGGELGTAIGEFRKAVRNDDEAEAPAKDA